MTGTELDEILSLDETPVAKEAPKEQQVTEDKGQPRDENGRFATQQPAQAQEQAQQPQEAPQQAAVHEEGTVPQQALHASRQREREAKQEADNLRAELAKMQGQIEILSRQSQARPQPAPVQREAPDFYADPDARLAYEQERLQAGFVDRLHQFSQHMAVDKYGKETVDAAFTALERAVQSGDYSAQAEHRRIMADPHPYGALVAWHKQRETLARVGSDPEAFFTTEFERRMSDPEFLKKVTARVTQVAQQPTRSAPNVQLPPSLNRLPAGSNAAPEADLSDAGLFANALR